MAEFEKKVRDVLKQKTENRNIKKEAALASFLMPEYDASEGPIRACFYEMKKLQKREEKRLDILHIKCCGHLTVPTAQINLL